MKKTKVCFFFKTNTYCNIILMLKYFFSLDVIQIRTGYNLIKHLTLNKQHHAKLKSFGYSLENFNRN